MSKYVIQAAYKTLQILLVFGEPPHRFTLSQIATCAHMEKGQAYRSLKTLEEAGFVRLEEDQRYVLTPVIHTLGLAAYNSSDSSLVKLADAQLSSLATTIRETVALFALAGDYAICLDIRESNKAVRWSSMIGRAISLHAGAAPKAILAFLSEEEQARILDELPLLPHYTPHTVTQRESLEAELTTTRERGYAVGNEDFDPETRAVAAPIFDQGGKVVAAISIGAPSFRFPSSLYPSYGAQVITAALVVSRQLGYVGGYPK